MKRTVSILVALILILASMPAMADGQIFMADASTPLKGASRAMLHNIELAAEAIDGIYIPYGEYFSFNDVVGPRSSDYGFKSAKNGRGAKVYGGGVSQVATTMYLALLEIPGVAFDEISTYGDRFTGDYVDDGEMAIVTDYSRGTDFAFTNYECDMVISMWQEDDMLHCSVSGSEMPYEVRDDGTILIGSHSFAISGSDGLISNIQRAANLIGCYELEHEGTFSFNDAVGARTRERGFVSALNGRGVKVTGGGVAQVASVIWLAMENLDDMIIVEKSTYGQRYNQKYVKSASDAILTDYNAGTDFSFKNMRHETVYIETYVEDGYLHCDIYVDDPEVTLDPIENPVLTW